MPYQNYRKNYKKNFIQKKKWASIMKDIPSTNVQIPGQSTGGAVATIVANAADSAVPTPTIIKVKHVRVAFDFTSAQYYFNGGFLCIMFVPQELHLMLVLHCCTPNGLWPGRVLN